MIFPVKKQIKVFTYDSRGMLESAEIGSAGLSVKAGIGPVNWKMERRKRYIVMGSQMMGMTHH